MQVGKLKRREFITLLGPSRLAARGARAADNEANCRNSSTAHQLTSTLTWQRPSDKD
jgi:hypothetical protein